jgi:hypothetical protein
MRVTALHKKSNRAVFRLNSNGIRLLELQRCQQSHRRERCRRGQKVARGKRAARSPWIANNKRFRPEGPTEHHGARACRPFGARALLGNDPGAACSLRFALAPGYLLSAPAALPSARAWGSCLFHPSRHLPFVPRDKFEPHRNRRLMTHGYNPLTPPDVSM